MTCKNNCFFGIIFSLLVFSTQVCAQGAIPTKQDDILATMELAGTIDLANNAVPHIKQRIMATLLKTFPKASDVAIKAINEELDAALADSVDDFKKMVVPIYDIHYTHEEIREIKAFFSSPTGKKYVRNTALINDQLSTVTQSWMKVSTQKALDRVVIRLKQGE